MFNFSPEGLLHFVIFIVILVLTMCLAVVLGVSIFQKKQLSNKRSVEEIKQKYKDIIIKSQLEVEEQTFRNVSKDIHKNIGQRLSLSTVFLLDLEKLSMDEIKANIKQTIVKLSEAMIDLRDISRGMSADIIKNNGLLKAFEFEARQLGKSGLYNVKLQITGTPFFLTANQELLIFRIMQESTSNIVRDANADTINIYLNFGASDLQLTIEDNENEGIRNHYVRGNNFTTIHSRIKVLNAFHEITNSKAGTKLFVNVPIKIAEPPAIP